MNHLFGSTSWTDSYISITLKKFGKHKLQHCKKILKKLYFIWKKVLLLFYIYIFFYNFLIIIWHYFYAKF